MQCCGDDLAKVPLRLLAGGIVLSMGLVVGTPMCAAADVWGGSVGVTSDYILRGVSRSNGRAALQVDLHYLNASGFVAGLFGSNTQIDPREPKDVELDAFLGFAWTAGNDWHGKVLASHYLYPWNRDGSGYDYDELDVDLAFHFGEKSPIWPWVARELLRVRVWMVASAEYLAQRGTPQSIADLAGHDLLAWEGPGEDGRLWPLQRGGTFAVNPVVVTRHIHLIRQFAIAGLGKTLDDIHRGKTLEAEFRGKARVDLPRPLEGRRFVPDLPEMGVAAGIGVPPVGEIHVAERG